MSGYITENRALIEAARNVAEKLNIKCELFCEDWVVRLSSNSKTHFIYGYDFDANTQATSAISADKVATYELLCSQGVESVPHYQVTDVFKQIPSTEQINSLLLRDKSLVVKPTSGSRGEYIGKYNSVVGVVKHISEHPALSWCVSKYTEIKSETRVVVFDGEIMLIYRKHNPVEKNNLKMFNLNLGASASRIDLDDLEPEVSKLARETMRVLGLGLAAVDVVIDEGGKPAVLEVNSGFSIEHYALLSDEHRAEAVKFYEEVIEYQFSNYTS